MDFLRRWNRKRVLNRYRFGEEAWQSAWRELPLLRGFGQSEARRLREQAVLFLHRKSIEPADGMELDEHALLVLALQAALPVLELGLEWYRGWLSVIVYPDEFVADYEEMDEAGVVHRIREARSGESWERGPLVLSWSDVATGAVLDGYNVTIHELAHKLDALNGPADGFPPLHGKMVPERWTRVFTDAYDDHGRRTEEGLPTVVDPYGAESPAEFFAVTSEAFFELPHTLVEGYPEVYGVLRDFYRQHPLERLG